MTSFTKIEDADRAGSGISRLEEKRIALSLSPDIAWPTLALAVVLPGTLLTVIYLGLSDRWPLWVCTPILAVVSYAHYTLVHEAIHGNVVGRPRRFYGINTVVGWIGALGMGAGWPVLQRTHVLHHAHTNTERDPDIFVKGTLGQLIGKWAVAVFMNLVPLALLKPFAPVRYQRLRKILTASEIAQTSAVTVLTLVLLAASLATGHFAAWLLLWFVPIRAAMLMLNILFQWLPHYPFDRTDRYGNTRISLWLGGRFATLQQNLHLMHHLWPSVPFYNYRRLYVALRPVLIAEGSPIQGFGVGRWARSKAGDIAVTARSL
ncbi:MAG: fatty acid desaturase [Rhizomicrobium sp.]